MRFNFVTPAACAVLLLSGCVAQPHFGKDDSRAAVVWENVPPGVTPPPTPPPEDDAERKLLSEIHEAQEPGGDALTLASGLYHLAILRRQQGQLAEAERLYQQALGIRERKQGADHPEVAVILNNLAAVKVAEGEYAAAQPLLERALAIRQTALGNQNLLTAESQSNLALLYAAQGNAAAAEPLYVGAIAVLEKTAGRGNDEPRSAMAPTDELARVLDNYAALLHETGRDVEAAQLEARARVMRAAAAKPAAAAP